MNIGELIQKKKEIRKAKATDVRFVDINKPLIMTLFALDVFGKDVLEEDVISQIVSSGNKGGAYELFCRAWEKHSEGATHIEGPMYKNKNGKIILRPRGY
jgi:hypothetical protein